MIILEIFFLFSAAGPAHCCRLAALAFLPKIFSNFPKINSFTLLSIILIISSYCRLSLSAESSPRLRLYLARIVSLSPPVQRGSCEIIYFSWQIYCMLTDALRKHRSFCFWYVSVISHGSILVWSNFKMYFIAWELKTHVLRIWWETTETVFTVYGAEDHCILGRLSPQGFGRQTQE